MLLRPTHNAAGCRGGHGRRVRPHPGRGRRRRVPIRLAHLVAAGQLAVAVCHVGETRRVHRGQRAVRVKPALVQVCVVHGGAGHRRSQPVTKRSPAVTHPFNVTAASCRVLRDANAVEGTGKIVLIQSQAISNYEHITPVRPLGQAKIK